MMDIARRTGGNDINEFLQNERTARVLRDAESANDGSERVPAQDFNAPHYGQVMYW